MCFSFINFLEKTNDRYWVGVMSSFKSKSLQSLHFYSHAFIFDNCSIMLPHTFIYIYRWIYYLAISHATRLLQSFKGVWLIMVCWSMLVWVCVPPSLLPSVSPQRAFSNFLLVIRCRIPSSSRVTEHRLIADVLFSVVHWKLAWTAHY